jgi:sugar lactone lactonase YvrE
VITADGGTLIVTESLGQRLTAFDISADGGLSNRRVWADLKPHQIGPDGICLDASGAVWVANAVSTTAVRIAEGASCWIRSGSPSPVLRACSAGPTTASCSR